MTETLALALIVLVDLGAAIGLGMAVAWWLRGWLPGLLAGFVVEIVRIVAATAITSPLHGFHGDALGWLADLRLFRVPILVVFGLAAGAAANRRAGLKRLTCPYCEAAIAVDIASMRQRATRGGEHASPLHRQPCPTCKTDVTYDVGTGEIVQPIIG